MGEVKIVVVCAGKEVVETESVQAPSPYPGHGMEARPVFLGDFDRYGGRGVHQVRVNLWGWPAAAVEWVMRRSWARRNMSPDRP